MAKKSELECLEIVQKAYLRIDVGTHVVFDNSDKDTFSRILFSASQTGNDNTFPDFVCDNAVIEHFQITSSKETRKGSDFLKSVSISNTEWKRRIEQEKENFKHSEYLPWMMITFSSEDIYTELSYDNFLESMRVNIENHIDSLMKSGITGKKVVFMMD